MKKLNSFYKFIETVLIVVILAIEGNIVECVKKSQLKEEWLILLVSVVLLIFIFKLLGWLIEKAVENSKRIRAIILGDDYIEGTWFDIVEIGGYKFYGLLNITYKEGKIEQSGEQIATDGSPKNTWNTIASQYEGNTLTVIYRVNYFAEEIVEQRLGISTMDFSKPEKQFCPNTFSGTFYDMSKDFDTKSFRGFKVTNPDILFKLSNPESKPQATKELINAQYLKPIQ